MTDHSFSFAAHAPSFDRHISDSIPGLCDLRAACISLSRRYVQDDTTVVDVGCSEGTVLKAIRDANDEMTMSTSYVGIDVEPKFREHWARHARQNLRFHVRDARTFDGFENMSLAVSLFTLQFVPDRDKMSVLKRIHEGLAEGGALVIAEKILASSARLQDVLTFEYYDHKLRNFSAEEILNKERGLRRQMHLWTDLELMDALCLAGFSADQIQRIWLQHPFVGLVAVKGGNRREYRRSPPA